MIQKVLETTRKEIGNIPLWCIAPVERYCDRKGTKFAQLLRDFIVSIAEEEQRTITLSGPDIETYKNLCRAQGTSAEVNLELHIKSVIRRQASR